MGGISACVDLNVPLKCVSATILKSKTS